MASQDDVADILAIKRKPTSKLDTILGTTRKPKAPTPQKHFTIGREGHHKGGIARELQSLMDGRRVVQTVAAPAAPTFKEKRLDALASEEVTEVTKWFAIACYWKVTVSKGHGRLL